MLSTSRVRSGLVLLMFYVMGLGLSACSSSSSNTPTTASDSQDSAVATLQEIQISLENDTLVPGLTTQAHAAALYSDNSSEQLGTRAQWFSSDSSVAGIDANGVITAQSAGTTTISVVLGDKVDSTRLSVVDAQLVALEITPADPRLAPGVQQQFEVQGRFSDDGTELEFDLTRLVSWSSSASAVVTVSDAAGSKGLATANAPGSAEIRTAYNGLDASMAVTVTNAMLSRIEISAPQTTLPTQAMVQLEATGIFSDGSKQNLSRQVDWSSDQQGVATVDDTGLLTTLAAGSALISLAYQGQTAALAIDVSNASLARIEIFPPHARLAAEETLQLHATGIYTDGTTLDVTRHATWDSDEPAIATVGNTDVNHGLASSLTPGRTTVSAHFNNHSQDSTVIVTTGSLQGLEIMPPDPGIAIGTQQRFRVIGHYDDGLTRDLSDQVTWRSTNPNIVRRLNASGDFKGVAAGTARVTAAMGEKITFAELTVTPAVLERITLSPGDTRLARDGMQLFHATGHFSDGSSQDIDQSVIWQSSDPGVASISNSERLPGRLISHAVRNTTISAAFDGITQSAHIDVTDAQLTALTIQLGRDSMTVGTEQSATLIAHYADNTARDVTAAATWTSSDPAVVSVSNFAAAKGRIAALGSGNVTLTASLDGVSTSAPLTTTTRPNAPVSISLFAEPRVILTNGADSSVVTVALLPAGANGNISNNTQIDIRISAAGNITQQTVFTSGGRASFDVSTTDAGFIAVEATVAGTDISATAYLYGAMDFASLISANGLRHARYDNGTLLKGSSFLLLVTNTSDRTFKVDRFVFSNGTASTSANGSEISGGQLTEGENYTLVGNIVEDQRDRGVRIVLTLTDVSTGQQFDVAETFTNPTP